MKIYKNLEEFICKSRNIEDILFYDGGYLDASNLIPIINPETQDVILITKEEVEKNE